MFQHASYYFQELFQSFMILSTNAEKAFDEIPSSFMIKALKKN
jgi:hypothetical protein